MSFWTLKASGEGDAKALEIEVFGVIEPGFWDDGGTKSADIAAQLAAHKDATSVTVHINSVGGDTFGGVAIYNLLRGHPAAKADKLVCVVEGLAASAASLIALAGRTRMLRGSMMMIHNPWTIAMGDANALRETAATLDAVRDSILSIYRAKTGKSEADLRALLDAETYLTADQAKAEGFADEVEATSVRAKSSAEGVIFNSVAFPRARVPAAMLAAVEPAAAPVPVVPATPAGDTSMLTRNPLLLAAVGLTDDADEPTFDGRIEALAHFEREVCAKLGVAGADEVLAKVTEAAAALVELPQLRAQIGAAQADSRKRDLRASLEGGLYQRRLNLGTISRTLPRLVADPGKREQLRAALGAIKVTTRAGILDAACSVDLTDSDLENVKDYIRDAPLVSPDPVREPSREGAELDMRAASVKRSKARTEAIVAEMDADPNLTPSAASVLAAKKQPALFADDNSTTNEGV